MLWTIVVVGITLIRLSIGGGEIVDPVGFVVVLVEIAIVSLAPLCLIFANSRSRDPRLSPIDQILHMIFYVLWLSIGLMFAFEIITGMIFALSIALPWLLVIVAKAVFATKDRSSKQPTEQRSASHLSKKALFLVLNVLTIWLPLGFAIGVMTYISIRYANEPDAGLAIIPIAIVVGPFLITGIVVAIITLIWQVRTLLVKRHSLSRTIIIWGSLWGLSSVTYVALWIWFLILLWNASH